MRRWLKISNGKESLGHWHWLHAKQTSTELWTWNWQGFCHMVSNQFWVFDVTCIALLVKQGTFPDPKINNPTANSEAIDNSRMWKEGWTYELRIRSYWPLTLSAYRTYWLTSYKLPLYLICFPAAAAIASLVDFQEFLPCSNFCVASSFNFIFSQILSLLFKRISFG